MPLSFRAYLQLIDSIRRGPLLTRARNPRQRRAGDWRGVRGPRRMQHDLGSRTQVFGNVSVAETARKLSGIAQECVRHGGMEKLFDDEL